MTRRARLLVSVLVVASVTVTALGTAATWTSAPFSAFPDSRFGAIVVDRASGSVLVDFHAHRQFRSASLVKLLITIDLLERPGRVLPDADRTLIGSMLRSSDDDAAGVLWVREGRAAIVERMVRRLGLVDTEPPSTSSGWGYTATSAADVARTYRYVLDEVPPAERDLVMTPLRAATRCAVDGHDQSFGLPRTAPGVLAVKQGWSGVGDPAPGTACTPAPASVVDPDAADRVAAGLPPVPRRTGSDPDIDLTRPAVHTSGVVGAHDDTIVVVLSLHPEGTTYERAAGEVDTVTGALLAATGAPSAVVAGTGRDHPDP